MDSRDLLVIYLSNQGIELREDNCIYRQNQCVGTDVSSIRYEGHEIKYSFRPIKAVEFIRTDKIEVIEVGIL